MKRIIFLVVASLLFQLGCSRSDSPSDQPTVAIVPFRTSGNAESGQYALLLSNFSTVLASEFGARSGWQVAESERLDTLKDEQAMEAPPAATAEPQANSVQTREASASRTELHTEVSTASRHEATTVIMTEEAASSSNNTSLAEAKEWAAKFPAADYVLLGHIRGFDVGPADGRSGGQKMGRRMNRVRSQIDVRIANVRTRAWVASRTVTVDEMLTDESAAETQINRAMNSAAEKVVTAVLLAVAREFTVTESQNGFVKVTGGTQKGLRQGQSFHVSGANVGPAPKIEITETFSDHAIARVAQGIVQVGDRVSAEPIQTANADATENTEPRISVAGFFLTGQPADQKADSSFLRQIKQELQTKFHQYSGLRVVEDRPGTINDLLGQQFFEDVNKGREPGLPMGSLHGVDYLVFSGLSVFEPKAGRREITRLFGTQIVEHIPDQLIFDARIFILDVSRGEYITSSDVSLDVDLQGKSAERALADAARVIGAEMFSRTILQIRPLAVVDGRDGHVVLNHTSAAGINIGDRFTVMTRGEDRLDANTKTWMRNVGGRKLAEIAITGFDGGGWAYAEHTGESIPAGALLVRAEEDAAETQQTTRKLTW